MKKIFILALAALIVVGCNKGKQGVLPECKKVYNTETGEWIDDAGPSEDVKKSLNEDTKEVLSLMNGMVAIESYWEKGFIDYSRLTVVTNGTDTLCIVTETRYEDALEARIYGTNLDDNEKIKKHNLLMNRLFAGNEHVTLGDYGNGIIAHVFKSSSIKIIGPHTSDKQYCRENTDTVIAHMNGVAVVDSSWSAHMFYNSKYDGKETRFYQYVKFTRVTNGIDTLWIEASGSETNSAWEAEVREHNLNNDDVDKIRRHNILMKELFANDKCVTLEADNNKILHATFRKEKPKEPERPLEDYGLDENDL